MATRKSGPLDAMVGARIRMFRVNRGISQAMLAERIGVTFQQVQNTNGAPTGLVRAGWRKSLPYSASRSVSCSNLPSADLPA